MENDRRCHVQDHTLKVAIPRDMILRYSTYILPTQVLIHKCRPFQLPSKFELVDAAQVDRGA